MNERVVPETGIIIFEARMKIGRLVSSHRGGMSDFLQLNGVVESVLYLGSDFELSTQCFDRFSCDQANVAAFRSLSIFKMLKLKS